MRSDRKAFLTSRYQREVFRYRCLAACLSAVLLTMISAPTTHAAPLRFGDDAPLFTLKDLDGREVSLADFTGPGRRPSANGVLLVFFATWCPSCREELPLIDSLAGEFRGRGIEILLIGYQEEREAIARYLKRLQVRNLPALVDRSGRVGKRYNLRVLPTIYAVSARGKIRDLLIGESRDVRHELRKFADKLEEK